MRILTIGTFDLLHPGHLELFRVGKQLGDLYVGVNSDAFVTAYKGHTPVQSETARSQLISALSGVKQVLVNADSGHTLIRNTMPNILLVGEDWMSKNYYEQVGMSRFEMQQLGITVLYCPLVPGYSSTALREQK